MRKIILLAAVAFAIAAAPAANAADWHDGTADAAATFVAGHTVPVYCSDSWLEWYNVFGADQGVGGFTNPSRSSVVFVSPRQCETLHALSAHEDVGTYYAASALLTLVHEATHQRGGSFANCTSADLSCEARTECAAIPLVPQIATSYYGIPATVTVPQTQTVTRTRKVGKRTIRVTSTFVGYIQQANPWLTRLATDVQRWHQGKPPVYRTLC